MINNTTAWKQLNDATVAPAFVIEVDIGFDEGSPGWALACPAPVSPVDVTPGRSDSETGCIVIPVTQLVWTAVTVMVLGLVREC